MPTKPRHILKSIILVAIASGFSKIVGFAREIVLAAFYGIGNTSDAFILAFTIPDTLLYFIAASVASSFIPMYYRVPNKTKFTRNVMTGLLLIGLFVSAIFTVFPGALIKLFAAQIDSETYALADYLVRYMIWSASFILLSEIFNARLEIARDFFSAGIRSVWRNVVVIAGIALGAITGNILLIAIAPVVGNALSMVSLASVSRKYYIYCPYFAPNSPELRQMLLMVGPMFLSTAITEICQIINRNFAASLSVGAISALNYSGKVAGLFVAMIGQSLFTVLFPHMSKLAADGDIAKLKSSLTSGIMYITAIMLPLCVGVIVLAQPSVRVLFQRGSFTTGDTILTASCLRMYALLMISGSINPLIMRTFYAIQNTKIPANVSVVTVFANIVINFFLIKPLGVEGLALASSLSSILTMLLLLFFLRKKLGYLGLRNNLSEFVKMALAAVVMGGGVWFATNVLPLMSAPIWQSVPFCFMLAVVAASTYIVILLLLRSKIGFGIIITTIKFFEQKRKHVS